MLWVKSLHIISIIAWMAGMLYLPRLMVYHADAEKGSTQSETFKIMERRLLKAIMTPAMIASWVFGLWLVFGFQMASFTDIWFLTKFAGVLALSGMHGFLSRQVKDFAKDQNQNSAKFFRMINEVPTLLMIIIVIMVVVKPF
jgi:putative membrane protein